MRLTIDAGKQQIDGTLSEREMISRIIRGEHQYCYFLKAKQDKLALLDASIERCDGNAIITAVYFLEQTMTSKLFNYEISKRPVAVDHYVSSLQSMGAARQNDLVDFLTMLGRYEEAAMVKLKQALSTSNAETKIRNLRSCKQNYFGFVGGGFGDVFDFWSAQIDDHVALLERQLPIEAQDAKLASQPPSEMNAKFLEIPRQPLLNQSVISTLFYCCLYHYGLPENLLASPTAIRKMHNLSEKQFVSTALVALSMRKHWSLVDELFEGKVNTCT